MANPLETTEALRGLSLVQGGDYHLSPATTSYPSTSSTYMATARPPASFQPFVISLYNVESDEARYPLNLMVNPSDVQFGHAKAIQNSYTRRGWVSTYWGSQPRTLTVNGASAAFYYNPNQVAETVDGLKIRNGGLSNYGRRKSLSFANLLALISYFKRNGAYYLNSPSEQTYWNDGTSRVIHVMDFVMISYDGTDHVGAFNTFTINDVATNPYRIEYNFEFVVAGVRGDFFDGHLRKDNNDSNPKVEISIQGEDMELTKTVRMDEDQLNEYYKTESIGSNISFEQEYDIDEATNEATYSTDLPTTGNPGYWIDSKGVQHPVSIVPANTVKVTRGGRDEEGHGLKVDYRTGSGDIRSLSDGVVTEVGRASDGEYYVIVKTQVPYNGQMVDAYVRYYHMDPQSLGSVSPGASVPAGSLVGTERYEGSTKYPPHCDLAVRVVDPSSPSWGSATPIDASTYFYSGVARLGSMTTFPDGSTDNDYVNKDHKHGEKSSPTTP